MENETNNLSKAVADGDFEKFANESDQRDISERLGTKSPEKAKLEVVKEPEPEKKAEPEKLKVGRLSYGELRAKLREQEAELRGLREGRREPEKVVESEPVAEEPKQLRARPKPEDLENGQPKYKTWEAYEDDLLDWNRERIFSELDERNTKKTQEATVTSINKAIEQSWAERCEASRKEHADFDEALDPEIGPGKQIQPGSIVDEWIMDSELGSEILYFFHKHPTEMKKFEDIKGPTPGARRATARRMLMKIEEQIKPAGKQSAEEEPQPAREEARISRTPPPSREVGGRGSVPADRVRAAVANDDVGAYMDEMDRRDIAARGLRR